MNRIILLLISFVVICPSAYSETGGKNGLFKNKIYTQKVALVIGNSSYNSSPLKTPRNDANDITIVLKELGFKVTVLYDVKRVKMMKSISSFGIQLKKGGVGLFYYSGHSFQVNERNYLIPIDEDIQAEDEIEFYGVDTDMVITKMNSAGNPLNMVFLDACHNSSFSRSKRLFQQGLAEMNAPQDSLIVYATAPGSIAVESDGKNSIFTKNLIKHIKTPGLELGMMLRRVRSDVLKETDDRQIPWDQSSLVENFYFKHGPAQTEIKEKGRIFISSEPHSAKIYVNDIFEGNSPISLNMEIGKYKIEARKKGYKPKNSLVTIKKGSNSALNLILGGSININSSPKSARIYLNNEYKGLSPIKVKGLTDDMYFLSLVKEGYQTYKQKVNILQSEDVNLNPVLIEQKTSSESIKSNDNQIKQVKAFYMLKGKNISNKQLLANVKNLLDSSLLFHESPNTENADISILIDPIENQSKIEVSIIGEVKTKPLKHKFSLIFDKKNLNNSKQISAKLGNRIIKSVFGFQGVLNSQILLSQKSRHHRSVLYLKRFGIAEQGRPLEFNRNDLIKEISWEPGFNKILYRRFTSKGTAVFIREIDANIDRSYLVYDNLGKDDSVSWGQNNQIIMSLRITSRNSDFYKFILDDKEDFQLIKSMRLTNINSTSFDTEGRISPEGNRLLFVSNRNGSPQIYLYNFDSNSLKRLTWKGRYNVNPAWSPDGKQIAYRGIRNRSDSIYRLSLDSGKEQKITPNSILASNPSWSPDGTLITFSGKKELNGISKAYYILSTGGEYRRLTNSKSEVEETIPTWGGYMK